ncbi:MAG TPA: putative Na+/H+ antiporter [Vicinamibacterales bacterium]|nr:putative Na+/H+ antiporter [Vicinamibacterales bacterium]
MLASPEPATFPRLLESYPPPAASLLETLSARLSAEPFNGVASAIFGLAILHTFAAPRFTALAHAVQHRHAVRQRQLGRSEVPSVLAEALHFFGEVEVVFGLWAIVLLAAITARFGWHTAAGYFNGTVNYTEPLFVIVIMALASTRPIILLAEDSLRVLARMGRGTPAAWWAIILTVGPLFGSLITEPGAMTICALLLGRQFYDLQPSTRLKYATLGLLFVNVSIGGTLTHFAAPPVLMVARLWNWDTPFMLDHFGWRAVTAIVASVVAYGLIFRRELAELGTRRAVPDIDVPEPPLDVPQDAPAAPVLLPVPAWITIVHVAFMAWTVFTAHYPALFLGGFLIFLGFVRATAPYQSLVELKAPLLVGFFLAGLVIHGGLQAWWIAPVLASLSENPLFATATILTAFNDNALITYLSTLVPNLSDSMKTAVMEGAVTGGGLTVIANAPNPAGQALLSRYFDGAVLPIWLLAGALLPTLMAVIAFRILP